MSVLVVYDRKGLHRVVFVLLLALGCLRCFAQQLYFKHFTVDEGLPSNEVYQVLEDNLGNLLIATDRGAARFDGYSIEALQLTEQKKVIPVYYLYKGKRGSVYFSALRGELYEYNQQGLAASPYNKLIAQQYRKAGIIIANSLAETKDSLWINFNNDHPTNLEVRTSLLLPDGTIKTWRRPEGFYFDFVHDFYYREYVEARKAAPRQHVYIRWPDGDTTVDSLTLSWPAGYVRRLFAATQGSYRLLSVGRQLMVYQDKKKVATHLFEEDVLFFTALSDGTIAVGLQHGGVDIYRLQRGRLVGPVAHHLFNLSVSCIYEDKQKGLWISTTDNGLYYAFPSRLQYDVKPEKIRTVDSWQNKMFAGYSSGKIEVYETNVLTTTYILPLKAGEALIRLSVQPDGVVIANSSRGYYVQNGGGWRFVPSLAMHVALRTNGQVYVTDLSYPELRIYEGHGGRLLKMLKLPERIESVYNDDDGSLWIGTWGGLYQYRDDSLYNLTRRLPVFNDRIVGIDKLPNGWMAIATLGRGLILLHGNKIVHLDADRELLSPIINSLRRDATSFYLGTNKGITVVTPGNDENVGVQHFGTEAGLPTLDVNQFAVTQGVLYGKWVDKLFYFSLASLQQHPFVPTVYLRSVVVNNDPAIEANDHVFAHNQNSFTFSYNSVNLSGAPQQTYTYQLQGFESKSHETSERQATYTNLPPGQYAFRVRVNDCLRKTSGLQVYRFAITPAFWQRAWFPWLIGLVLLSLVYLLFRLQLRIAKQKHNLHLQLAESNQRALIQLINPHFISNLLNTVHAAILKENKIEAASVISKFARLMRLTMEVGKEKFIRLERELTLIQEYLALEKLRAPDKFDYTINLGPDVRPDRVYIPGMLIQPFVENAIKHGIMHLPYKGHIVISISLRGRTLQCRVEDNGIGVDNARRINANKLSSHQSAGIKITVNRLMLLHQENKGEFVYEVEKKSPLEDSFPGTVVTFSLPFKYPN